MTNGKKYGIILWMIEPVRIRTFGLPYRIWFLSEVFCLEALYMKRLKNSVSLLLVLCASVTAASCSGGNTSASPQTEASAASAGAVSAESEKTADDPETTEPVVTEEPDAEETVSDTSETGLDNDIEEPAVSETELSDSETPRADSSDHIVEDSGEESTSAQETESDPAETTSAETTAAASETAAPETTTTTAAPETTTTTAAPETTTTTAAPETTAATTTVAAQTTAAETTKAPAQPSPPMISEVSSPGINVFAADTVTFDYSNCALGYISVNYTGSTRLKMLLKKGDSQFDYDIYPAKGAQYFTLAQGSGSYTAEVYEMLDNGKFVKLLGEDFKVSIRDETNMFLYRNQFVNFNANSACVAKASEVCAGCTSNIEKISAVFGYVTDNITYDKALAASVTSGYIPDPDSVLARKKGICFDYASLTAAMLRSQGVPARLIIGYASPNIYHAWNEVYTPEKGWIAAEIALDGSGFRRIDATFYASASNKQNFADYIAQSGNYSDVYVY